MKFSVNVPGFKVVLGRQLYAAKNQVIEVVDEEHLAELQGFMKTRPDIRSVMREIDVEAAEKLAKEVQAKQVASAVKGAHGTASAAIARGGANKPPQAPGITAETKNKAVDEDAPKPRSVADTLKARAAKSAAGK